MNWKSVKLSEGVTATEADRRFGERKQLLAARGREDRRGDLLNLKFVPISKLKEQFNFKINNIFQLNCSFNIIFIF
jgi:hypothetical protein